MDISSIGPMIQTPEQLQPGGAVRALEPPRSEAAEQTGGTTFADLLRQVVQSENAADQAAETYATGETQNLHETMTTLQMADIQFSLLVSVRNKVLEAYREVMRMG